MATRTVLARQIAAPLANPTSSSSSSAAAATTTSPPQSGGGSSSSLYLFTFLATLFVLLAVSFAIAFRSFILRRRFRMRVEAALARGETVPGMDEYLITGNLPNLAVGGTAAAAARRRRYGNGGAPLGPRPEMWEVLMSDEKESLIPMTEKEDLEPVSVSLTIPPTLPAPPAISIAQPQQPQTQVYALPPVRFFSWGRSQPPIPVPAVVAPVPQIQQQSQHESAELLETDGMVVNASVLILMPSDDEMVTLDREDGEREVPDIEVGVARLFISGNHSGGRK